MQKNDHFVKTGAGNKKDMDGKDGHLAHGPGVRRCCFFPVEIDLEM